MTEQLHSLPISVLLTIVGFCVCGVRGVNIKFSRCNKGPSSVDCEFKRERDLKKDRERVLGDQT